MVLVSAQERGEGGLTRDVAGSIRGGNCMSGAGGGLAGAQRNSCTCFTCRAAFTVPYQLYPPEPINTFASVGTIEVSKSHQFTSSRQSRTHHSRSQILSISHSHTHQAPTRDTPL